MNFTMSVKTTTHLFTIKNKLREHHGRIEDLMICKNKVQESNEMTDETKTLEDYGIKGVPLDSIKPSVTVLWYDFRPSDHNEPLLLTSNATALYKELLKDEAEEKERDERKR